MRQVSITRLWVLLPLALIVLLLATMDRWRTVPPVSRTVQQATQPAAAPRQIPAAAPIQQGEPLSSNFALPRTTSPTVALLASPKFAFDRTLFLVTERHLFRSTDAGENWQRAMWADPSPHFAAATIADMSNDRLTLLLTTTRGELWQTDAGQVTWEPISERLNPASVFPGEFDPAAVMAKLYDAEITFDEVGNPLIIHDREGARMTKQIILDASFVENGVRRHVLVTEEEWSPAVRGRKFPVDVALFTSTGSGWTVDRFFPAVQVLGAERGVLPAELVKIGPDATAIRLTDATFDSSFDLAEIGAEFDNTVLLGDIDGELQEIFAFPTRLAAPCPSLPRDECTIEEKSTLSFVPGVFPRFHDILVETTGNQWIDGELQPLEQTRRFVFVEALGRYALVEGGDLSAHLTLLTGYAGNFYREVFNYSPDAPNIGHYVLLLPEAEAARQAEALGIFSHIRFPASLDDPIELAPESERWEWALPYLHKAPGGHFQGRVEPGVYHAAAALLAAPLSRAEAGVDDDVLLYAGITGGGASSDFSTVTVEPDTRNFASIVLTDKEGWACPWLYVRDGEQYVRVTEILRNVAGVQHETTETTYLGRLPVVNGSLRFRIAEDKAEITYIDAFAVTVGENILRASLPALRHADGAYVVLHEGESVEIVLPLPRELAQQAAAAVTVSATGYYVQEGTSFVPLSREPENDPQ